MVGEEAQEMQLAHWIPTTPIGGLANVIPGWMGLWFAVFPTIETLGAQTIAAAIVVGSYWLARKPATQQECHAECATDSEESSSRGNTSHCDPMCVSATICRPNRDLEPSDPLV